VGVECVDEHGELHRLYNAETIATLGRAAPRHRASRSVVLVHEKLDW
jgi:hypothetical protein